MKVKVSDYVIKRLEETGARHMFMLPGGGAMHLNDSLGKSKHIQYVCCLHEQACAIAAEAYARVSGGIGLLMVTTGPGGTNAMTGIAGAWLESTPVFAVSGQVKRADMVNGQGVRQQGMQELDIVSIVRPVTKYAALVDDPMMIRYHMERALHEALSGRKGPVWLDIPLDVQAEWVEEDELPGFTPMEQQKVSCLEQQVLEVIGKINRSEMPVLLAGNGIRLAGAASLFQRAVDILQVPVLTTWNGIDLIEERNPLYFGRPGGLGHRYANFMQQNADLFLSIGARLNLLQTGYCFDGFAKNAFQIMVDIDSAELHKANVRPGLAVCADAKEFLALLLKHKDKVVKKDRSKWLAYGRRLREKYPVVSPQYWERKELVNPYCLLEVLSKQMQPEDIYVSGSSGSCIDISMQAFQVKKGQRVFCTKGLASMGYGLPSAVGACLASGGRRTVGVNGDGGFAMNIQELETVRRLSLPIKLFVLNNQGYGAIKATQTGLFGGRLVGCTKESGVTLPPAAKIAAAYGLHTEVIHNHSELEEKVSQALHAKGPVVCEVLTPIEVTAQPKQVSYKRADGQMESLPLEYMSPPLSEQEMRENMAVCASLGMTGDRIEK